MLFDAIVLAGSSQAGALKEYAQADNEALIPLGEKMMIEYVVQALQDAASVDRIVIVGPLAHLAPLYQGQTGLLLAEPGDSQISTLLNGLAILQPRPEQRLLIVTSDIPLLTGAAVEDFLLQCSQRQGDLFYPIVPQKISEERFPGIKRTYINLRDGVFTGGNLFLVRASIIPPCAAKAEELVRLRKSPLALSRQIGLVFIIKFLCRRLTLRETEIKFSQLLGIEGHGIISSYPEVGIDVDKPSDLDLVKSILNG